MIAPVFVDANIFVYSRQMSDPRRQRMAVEWLERLWDERLGRTSVQALNECYSVLTRKIRPVVPREVAWDFIRNHLTWNPQPVDKELMLRAREIEQRHRLNWWDSLIVGAAQLQNCALLLSEDLQDGAVYGGVTVRNPFSIGVAEALASYAVTRSRSTGHPRRGRPRRVGTAR